jgi:hypothetical protein
MMNWNECERTNSWIHLLYQNDIFLEALGKTGETAVVSDINQLQQTGLTTGL